jgi:hypothetical protein
MQGFHKVSWKIAFTFENYARQPTQVLVPWEHLSCSVRSSFPEQGVTCHIFLHSAEVCPSKRDQSLDAQSGKSFPSTLPWCGAQSLIQAIHCLLRTMHDHPNSTKRVKPQYSPSWWSTQGPLADHPIHQWLWALRGPTHVHVFLQDIRRTVAECPLTCEQKKIQMTFPTHSKSPGRHGFYGARITAALVLSS